MIKVYKSNKAPTSLATQAKYDGDDVKALLAQDQYNKCYICERKRTTDFEIEHLHSQQNYPDEKYNWENLLFACSYCNGRKLSLFDDIINPLQEVVEEKIVQKINYTDRKADFTPTLQGEVVQQTIRLLGRIFNGSDRSRKFREERFFEEFLSRMNIFQAAINDYLASPSKETRQVIRELLSIEEEFLGFKYWIIKENSALLAEFSSDIIWNKNSK